MKTLKQIKSEITPAQTLRAIERFYSCKMGGTRKLFIDGVQVVFNDEREYYSGRGAKYNAPIRHDEQIYHLSSREYDKKVNEIAKKIYTKQKKEHERIISEKKYAKDWKDSIVEHINDVKAHWHLGRCRVWHNVIPCLHDSDRFKYLNNQLRNWLLFNNRFEKFGFTYYENDYNYSDRYFLSKCKSLNKNNPEIWAIFDRELGCLEVSEEKIKEYYS